MPLLAVDEDRAHTERARTFDVLLERVADHDGGGGIHTELLQRRLEDGRVRLYEAVRTRSDDRVDVEAVVRDELPQVANPVRDQAEPQLRAAQLLQNRQRVLVQLEVLRDLPALFDLGRTLGRDLLRPAHS